MRTKTLGLFLLVASSPALRAQTGDAKDAILWLHAKDDAIPAAAADDARPTILYFTFDT